MIPPSPGAHQNMKCFCFHELDGARDVPARSKLTARRDFENFSRAKVSAALRAGMSRAPSSRALSLRGGLVAFAVLIFLSLACLSSLADEVQECSQQGLLDSLSIDHEALFTEDCSITIDTPISITEDTIIDAQGFNVSISGANQFLIFEITNNASLTISGVTITAGQNTNGGAFFVYDGCTLMLDTCTLAGNQAIGTNGVDGGNGSDSATGNAGNGKNAMPAGTAYGGAIFNLGSVTLVNCTLATNSATGGTGGNGGNGGNSTAILGVGGNGGNGTAGGAAFGGAIYHAGELLEIDSCIFSGNTVAAGNGGTGGTGGTGYRAGLAGSGRAGAQGSGAAVYSTNQVFVGQSTFVNNTARGGDSAAGGTDSNGIGISGARGGDGFGGGLFVAGGGVTNCTFYLNDARGGKGGDGGPGTSQLATGGNGGNGGNATGAALYNISNSDPDVGFFLVSCTISNCSAFGGTNGAAGAGPFPGTAGSKGASRGSIARGSGAFTLLYSILATNLSGGASFGTIQDGDYNITFGNTLSLTSGTSFKTNNARLAPLGDNGGLTPTMALQVDSPALDRIPTNVDFPDTDQRGQSRPQGAGADIGAYEAGPPLVQLTNQIASLGSDVTFTAFAAGDPPITYQWQLHGTNISRAHSSTFVVTNATPENSGPYDVVVSNKFGTATSPSVQVNFRPTIISPPTSQTVEQGNLAMFSVTNTGDTPLTYRWYFRGTNGGSTNLARQFLNSSGAPTNSDVLRIANVFSTNLGTYFVSISNQFSSVTSAPVTLSFGGGPAIISQPASVTTNAGSSVTFSVTASGNPAPSYQWQFNSTNLGGANGTSFTLSNVQTNNSGSYTVVVSNSVASITSAPAVLTVLGSAGPATITVQPVSQIVVAGSNATFSVVAEGAPPLAYQWRFNGTNIAGATLSSYTRVHAQTNHAGFYDVFVSNGYGSDESDPNVTLRILAAPVSVSNLGLSAGAFSLTFGSQTGITYVVQYKNTLSTPTWSTLLTTNGTGSAVIIQDPLTNASRFYRIRAQ